MKIYELVSEQTIAPTGTMAQGGTTPMASTTPTQTQPGAQSTPGAQTTATNMAAMAQDPKIGSQIKSNLNNLKDMLSQAGGGNIDTSKITQAMTQPDPTKPMNPQLQAALKSMVPGLADAMQNQQAASQIKSGIKTGLQAQQAAQLARQKQIDQQIAVTPK
jgi:hypothetical protein